MSLRRWMLVAVAGMILLLSGVGLNRLAHPQWQGKQKMIVLGIDGMDPQLLRRFMAEGKMPNFSALANQGSFRELTTSIPPLSPVAWSSVITGMDPGGHGIFGFAHREPRTMMPYMSMARVEPAKHTYKIGDWKVPLGNGEVENLRHGKAFWQYLDDDGVPAMLYRMPANFPPVPTQAHTLAGMGTPDLRGGAETFVIYTEDPQAPYGEVTGGEVLPFLRKDWQLRASLYGPPNTLRVGSPLSHIPFTVDVDPVKPVARLNIGDQQFVLREGEWSDWIHLEFSIIPGVQSVKAICRLFLKKVHPKVELYVSPMNLDPADPALPISTPADWSESLQHELGDFYTAGFQEETSALNDGLLSDSEYLQQSKEVFAEHKRALEHELRNFRRGFFFFYFSSIDLNSHMLWRTIDPQHPEYDPNMDAEAANAFADFYQKMDEVLGEVMARMDKETTLMVLSDHGFGPYYRSFNLNTWLLRNRYIVLQAGASPEADRFFEGVDWSKTRAYGLDCSGLYVNLKGREKRGSVDPKDANELLAEIKQKLLAVRDPINHAQVITNVYLASRIYHGKYANAGPDALVGYARGYHSGWKSMLGGLTNAVIEENKKPWSGDHCNDYTQVPGILLSNRKIQMEAPALTDIAPTILAEFGIEQPSQMKGHSVFEKMNASMGPGSKEH